MKLASLKGQARALCAKFTTAKWLFLAFVFATIISALAKESKRDEAVKREAPVSADTYIPAGHVLVPIEIQNREALEAIVGQYGVVDLFAAVNGINSSPRKIVSGVKLIRAPLDENQFAVLVPENETPLLLAAQAPFFVVIQNPNNSSNRFNHVNKKLPRIYIESN